MNQRCPPSPIVQVELAVAYKWSLPSTAPEIAAFAWREPDACVTVAFGYAKGGSNAGVTAMKQVVDPLSAILDAFAGLFGALVQTLPRVFLAGAIALGAVWLVNHPGNSLVRMPAWLQASEQNSAPQNQNSMPLKSPSGTPQGQ